jgi:pseudo-rSAM protein
MNIEENKYWLFLEPYVYISLQEKEVLLINTMNKENYISNDKYIISIVKEIKENENVTNIQINFDKNSKSITELLNWLRMSYSGDYYMAEKTLKPIQIISTKNFSNEYKSKKDNIQMNIVFFINSSCKENCQNCNLFNKQFIYCKKSEYSQELDIDIIKNVVESINEKNLEDVSIIGGNIFDHSQLKSILYYLSKKKFKKTFVLNIKHINNVNDLSIFKIKNYELNIKSTAEDLKKYLRINEQLVFADINYKIDLVYEDINRDDFFYENVNINRRPFFNKNNLLFFEKYVYLEREDILSNIPSYDYLETNKYINQYFYGKLIIDFNGNAFVSFNYNRIGNIFTDSFSKILDTIYNEKSPWWLTRQNVTYCKGCVFNQLCPPISDYELYIGKYNLCLLK